MLKLNVEATDGETEPTTKEEGVNDDSSIERSEEISEN